MKSDISKTKIDRVACAITIIAHKNDKQVLVDEDELKWHIYRGGYDGYLKLEEISNQLKKLGYQGTIRVIWEMGLRGEIYLYGNYHPETWENHGTTRGYA